MSRCTIVALCLALCPLSFVPAAAQERAPTPDILVEGQRDTVPTQSEVTHEAREVTQGGDFRHSPLPRFEDPVCPGVMGLTLDAAEMMVDRLRYNAEKLGLRLASDNGCAPNLIVAFVPDARGQLAALAHDHGYLFASLDLTEKRALLAESGPARVWTTTVMKTRDGMPVYGSNPRPGDPMSSAPVVSMWMAHSRIYLPIRNDIAQVMVLFDRDQVKGKTIIQLADYATMRGLAKTKPAGDSKGPDTILALFETPTPPTGLTEFDRAYLASLYDGIPNIPGITKIGGVNRQLRRQAADEAQPARE
jgi:hypothetical protein